MFDTESSTTYISGEGPTFRDVSDNDGHPHDAVVEKIVGGYETAVAALLATKGSTPETFTHLLDTMTDHLFGYVAHEAASEHERYFGPALKRLDEAAKLEHEAFRARMANDPILKRERAQAALSFGEQMASAYAVPGSPFAKWIEGSQAYVAAQNAALGEV